jgi:hypothetical protein
VPDAGRNLGSPLGPWKEQVTGREPALGLEADVPAAGSRGFSLLAANVGNADVLRCDTAVFKLCSAESEHAVAERIAALRPDVVLLTEVLTSSVCALQQSWEPWHACHPENRAAEPEQVRRLLGAEYVIACEPRNGYECVAVRRGFATFEGEVRVAPAVAGCDSGFTVSAVTLRVDGRLLDLINAHPPSGASPEAMACRRASLEAVLEPPGSASSLRLNPLALMGGDFNFDPYRGSATDPDVAYWRKRVRRRWSVPGGPFVSHSGPVERDPPYRTSPLLRKTLDHVASEGLIGRCVTLGGARYHPPLDMNLGGELQRLDHLAQYCVLSFP